MSRSISHCVRHGEYMEFGPTYRCPECESEATVTPAPEADEWREVADARIVMIEETATRIAELEAEVERLRALNADLARQVTSAELDVATLHGRLRKGRTDENSNRAASAVDSETAHAKVLASVNTSDAIQKRNAASALLRANLACAHDSSADPRLGLPQPDGEPCTPMSARAWRWLP